MDSEACLTMTSEESNRLEKVQPEALYGILASESSWRHVVSKLIASVKKRLDIVISSSSKFRQRSQS